MRKDEEKVLKKYQISENFGKDRHAGSKAKNDAVAILKELGFEELLIIWIYPFSHSLENTIYKCFAYNRKILSQMTCNDRVTNSLNQN